MRKRTLVGSSSMAVLLLALGCGRSPIDLDSSRRPEAEAEVLLLVANMPADVGCITVVISQNETRRYPFGAAAIGGQQELRVLGVPTGPTVIAAEAHAAACGPNLTTADAAWLGGPRSVSLVAGLNYVSLDMRRASSVDVSINFPTGEAAICAPEGWVCSEGAHCCSGTCNVNSGELTGRCAPDAPPGFVLGDLQPGVGYLVYPDSGGFGCNTGPSAPFVVAVPPGGEKCLTLPGTAAMRIAAPTVCTTFDGQCAACTTPDCLPSACFPSPDVPDGPCASGIERLGAVGGVTTYYLVVEKRPDVTSEADGAPLILVSTEGPAPLSINLPAGEKSFVYGELKEPMKLGPDTEPEGGDVCYSFCGILDFRSAGIAGGWRFSGQGYIAYSPFR